MTSLGAHLYLPHFKQLVITKTPTDGSGWFEGLASTWDVDRDGERFAYGAWTNSLAEWQKAGSTPPVFWQHRTADPDDIIGRVLTMRETFDGLLITAQLDLSNPLAVSTYERMLAGTLDAMSIGFIYDRKHVDASSGIVVIDSAELLEVSLTPVPSNPRALVSQVKEVTPLDPVQADIADWNRRIADAAAAKNVARPPVDVDAFVLETKQMMVEEKLAEAEQAAWEERMRINTVLTPVPIRVDPRMRLIDDLEESTRGR